MNSKKIIKSGLAFMSCATLLMGCGQSNTAASGDDAAKGQTGQENAAETYADATQIQLSDDGITVDGESVATDDAAAVYIANDIVYYEDGKDFTYGEGTEADAHTKEEADAHTVVHITEPGSYLVSGSLSAGQIAVDLGEDAEEDPEAVVTLILNNVDVTCSVAPAVIFYDVYECGSTDEEQATKDVDTAAAGANVIIADGSVNNISGSYVARIYESYELSEDGTEVVDSKKLHKYDGAFYSKMSMNVDGGEEGSGVLNITAENEGLDSELHLTVNGGNINITSGNDGINTNEDGISVTTINGGNVNIEVNGSTGEGDGIDSNGWLVINGGSVTAAACATSGDAGIDSDMGIHINGGTVVATGNMLDHISESDQNYLVLNFASSQKGGTTYALKGKADAILGEYTPVNDFTYLIISSEDLIEGTYSLWMGDTQLAGAASEGGMAGPGMGGKGELPEGMEVPEGTELPEGMEAPEGMERPEGAELPEGMEVPEGMERPEGAELPEGMEAPEGMERPDGAEAPEGMERPDGTELPDGAEAPEGMERPDGTELPEGAEAPEGMEKPDGFSGKGAGMGEVSTEFVIAAGGTYYSNISAAE